MVGTESSPTYSLISILTHIVRDKSLNIEAYLNGPKLAFWSFTTFFYYFQIVNLVRYAQSLGIHVTAFSPLGHGASYFNPSVAVINEKIVKTMASKHGKISLQIRLKGFTF